MTDSQQLIARIKSVWDHCDPETRQIIDDMFGIIERVETDLTVLNLRIQKQWSPRLNLYTHEELDHECLKHYSRGRSDAQQEEVEFLQQLLK